MKSDNNKHSLAITLGRQAKGRNDGYHVPTQLNQQAKSSGGAQANLEANKVAFGDVSGMEWFQGRWFAKGKTPASQPTRSQEALPPVERKQGAKVVAKSPSPTKTAIEVAQENAKKRDGRADSTNTRLYRIAPSENLY